MGGRLRVNCNPGRSTRTKVKLRLLLNTSTQLCHSNQGNMITYLLYRAANLCIYIRYLVQQHPNVAARVLQVSGHYQLCFTNKANNTTMRKLQHSTSRRISASMSGSCILPITATITQIQVGSVRRAQPLLYSTQVVEDIINVYTDPAPGRSLQQPVILTSLPTMQRRLKQVVGSVGRSEMRICIHTYAKTQAHYQCGTLSFQGPFQHRKCQEKSQLIRATEALDIRTLIGCISLFSALAFSMLELSTSQLSNSIGLLYHVSRNLGISDLLKDKPRSRQTLITPTSLV